MDNAPLNDAPKDKPKENLAIRIFGVGDGGMKMMQRMAEDGPPCSCLVGVNVEPPADSLGFEHVSLETAFLRGLGSCGDPERSRGLAESHSERLKSLCEGQDIVFVVAGLGGGTGSGMAPVIARAAKDAKALVLCFVSLPFECEGNHRHRCAQEALQELHEVADAVICLPNQKVFRLIDDNTGAREAFALPNQLLADCARSLWRMLIHSGLIEIRISEFCDLLRAQHGQCAFAAAEAAGATRSREVLDKLLAHPLLEGGSMLADCEGVLVSVIGGPDLTMTEIDRIMQELNSRCGEASVIVGAVIDEAFRERVAVTVIAVPKLAASPRGEITGRNGNGVESIDRQLLSGSGAPRPGSRFVPPPPSLPPEQVQQMLARQGPGKSRARKVMPKFRQTHLPLEIISKGRFDKSEPTIHKGEDLDVPTYIRRGVSLN